MICRKNQRQNYRKHRSTREGGWNHLECNMCSSLDRKIKSEKDDGEREKLKDTLKYHKKLAGAAKEKYYATRAKAVRNKANGDISMIIDAGGGSGCSHIPRFQSTEKGEPARHTMLKIKTTFVKVHGTGSLLLVTFPDTEKQGGNLTVECIMRGIRFAMKFGNIGKLRNLYIQLDNVSSNKCYTIISSMTALVSTGVCKKIKIHYLIVGHTHEDIDALIGIVLCIFITICVF